MSSPPAYVQNVSIKISHCGLTRRFKLNLREINIDTFEDKVRDFLHLPPGSYKIERYSDSAGEYVVLDRANVSVYKQLYRAAKAKLKLKIRVTDLQPISATPQPQPVTIETEVEPPVEEPRAEEPPAELAADTDTNEIVVEKFVSPAEPAPLVAAWSAPLGLRPVTGPDDSTVAYQVNDALQTPPEVPKKEPLDVASPTPQSQDTLSVHDEPSAMDPATGPLTLSSAAEQYPPVEAARSCAYASLGFGDFRVCCNSCERTIPDVHYHCNKCDDDDFDLCLSCVKGGITCYGPDHWMIKRFRRNGMFVTSTTERLPPKSKPKKEPVSETAKSETAKEMDELRKRITLDIRPPTSTRQVSYKSHPNVRACNNCVRERPEHHFLHCTTCDDFDLCTSCFSRGNHGHHPKHAFEPAVQNGPIADHLSAKLGPGRNQTHNAICDNCDNFIRGVRHKCLDCPDWDYCNGCAQNATTEHPGHRFAPIYEALAEPSRFKYQTVHEGICCDGPVCGVSPVAAYITGVRYKCAVCPDTDFCGACEAHPLNCHNRTHPLIKFKTAVRQAIVSTSGLDGNGAQMPWMGDSPAMATQPSEPTMSSPRAVVDVPPSQPAVAKRPEQAAESQAEPQVKEVPQLVTEVKPAAAAAVEKKVPSVPDLGAVYVRDTVMDGTVLQPNHVFEQTWVLRNSGDVAWPAGCAVKFVGGDYMGHVDSNHPAGISELVSASESTVCYNTLEPGQEYPFTVLLRTPPREGKVISYWRLTTRDGLRFGHRLWCDISVQAPPEPASDVATSTAVESEASTKQDEAAVDSSQMVFPKLEKESPVSSMHQDSTTKEGEAATNEVDEWKSGADWEGSDDGFFTDEEYDILDASDEEWIEDQKLKSLKK